MKVKLYTKATKGLVSKLLMKIIDKHTGVETDVQMNDLDIEIKDGEMTIKTNVEIKLDKQEFIDLVKMYC